MKLDENYTSGKYSNCIFSKVFNKNYVDMALSLNNGKLEFETKFNDKTFKTKKIIICLVYKREGNLIFFLNNLLQ